MALALSRFHGPYERLVAPRKRALFDGIAGTVLEIGPGTGANFAYYPPDIRWIGIEPNPVMYPYLRATAARTGLSIDIRDGRADYLEFDDESVDAVVSTLVLCSGPDVSAALREIQRVRQGFAGVAYQRFRLPIPLVSPHITGVATKRTAVGHTVCPSTVFSSSWSG